jgi:hypothetical protein
MHQVCGRHRQRMIGACHAPIGGRGLGHRPDSLVSVLRRQTSVANHDSAGPSSPPARSCRLMFRTPGWWSCPSGPRAWRFTTRSSDRRTSAPHPYRNQPRTRSAMTACPAQTCARASRHRAGAGSAFMRAAPGPRPSGGSFVRTSDPSCRHRASGTLMRRRASPGALLLSSAKRRWSVGWDGSVDQVGIHPRFRL